MNAQIPLPEPRDRSRARLLMRVGVSAVALSVAAAAGLWMGLAEAGPQAAPTNQAALDFNTLRLHGYPALGHPDDDPYGNRPATAGSDSQDDPLTGQVPEDPPYTDGEGPFDPQSDEAPEMDFVTWNPAWISERLGDPDLRADWPELTGIDEVSAATNIRAGGINASEKVWLRHWYEPYHLDTDLNADGRLTSDDEDDQDYGVPDAPVNPEPSAIDEWYPAIMTELTYMLVDNDPLPLADPEADELHASAPRAICGRAGGTSMVFPIGISEAQTDLSGDVEGFGLTSLDADFDGEIDMVRVADELSLPGVIGGTRIDFDGDGILDGIDTDGTPLSCDEMAVLHTEAFIIEPGERVQFLDHFVEVRSVAGNSAQLSVYYSGDLVPRLIQNRSLGIGSVALAGDTGPLQTIGPGGDNLGVVPVGAWFVYVQDVDADNDSVIVLLGRALGAPCASMQSGPQMSNLSAGGPYFLKRFYVDGHEYNVAGIYACDSRSLQYISLRAPIPKVPVTLESHSVRLRGYDVRQRLPLPPPFNYEHTILTDVVAGEAFENVTTPDTDMPRPQIHYMGGPHGPVPPVLGGEDPPIYEGRNPNAPVGPYDDVRAMTFLYAEEDVDPAFLGQLREKMGAGRPDGPSAQDEDFFYNEQIFTLPWNYTEFVLPNQAEAAGDDAVEADKYLVTTAFTNPTARWRRWGMPDGPVPSEIPPPPPDLMANVTADGGRPLGAPRRAAFEFDPDEGDKIFYDDAGVRIYGGLPEPDDVDCSPTRPARALSAGDLSARDPQDPSLPIEVAPYTDPFAPFNPQHPHAPRADSITVNPAYMDEFLNFGEDLRRLYQQISNNGQNAREKVYHRLWYEPDYLSKIRFANDCDRDLGFPAVVQEYTYLYLDMNDAPGAAPPGLSRFAFPIGTRADELPAPGDDGNLPAGGEFGYGLTTFDADFDDAHDAVTVQTEETLAAHLDTVWQANRPTIPGFPPAVIAGPILDFDGDGVIDDLDEDDASLTGDEMVVFTVDSIALDLDPATDEGSSAMFLDHMVTLENVTRGSRAQLQFWFTGGNGSNARPERVGGPRSLNIGDAAIVDRFQDQVLIVSPDGMNTGTDGAWFAFIETVDSDEDRVTLTIGRALGASHSAIDDGAGGHDMEPGDPWYLKRFYVDGHEYNVTAVMTHSVPSINAVLEPGDEVFQFITIRTPVPKGNYFNPQDTLWLQGYFLDGQPARMSVMPPHNVDHTIAVDIERIDLSEFADPSGLTRCIGELRAAEPLEETILEEEPEPRFWTELREIWDRDQGGFRWETDQQHTTPYNFTDISLPDGQQYLLTLNWTSPVSRLAFYGCTLADPGPFPKGEVGITHQELADIAGGWAPPDDILPAPNRDRVVEVDNDDVTVDYYDARIGTRDVRVKFFYDPTDADDPYIGTKPITVTLPAQPDIRVVKRLLSPDPTLVGATVSFAITVTNVGDVLLTDVDVSDTFDTDYLDYDSASIAPDAVDEIGGTIDWQDIEGNAPGGTFDPGENIVILVDFIATAETPDPMKAVNTALVTAGPGGAVTDRSTDDVEINTPQIDIDKQLATADPTTVGSTMTFTVTVMNTGTAELVNVDLSDSFDTAYMDFLSATVPPDFVNEGAGLIIWNDLETQAPGGTFDPGEEIVVLVNFTATAATPDPDKAENTASATAFNGRVTSGSVTDDVEINPVDNPSVQITKQLLSSNPTGVGSTVRFEILISNNGNMVLNDVDVFDTFPAAYLSFSSASIPPTNVNVGTMEWQDIEGNAPGGDFDPGETITIDVDFTAIAATPPGMSAVNAASVSAEGDTVTDGPSMARVNIDSTPIPAIEVTKELLTPDPTTVGVTVSFNIAIHNIGNTILTDVDVSDAYDSAYMSFDAASIAPDGTLPLGSLTWDDIEGSAPGATFDPGETINIMVDFTAIASSDPGRAENSVQVSAEAGTILAGPAVASVDINAPAVSIEKRLLTSDPATVGEDVQFEIRITNTGDIPLFDVNVLDVFDPAVLGYQTSTIFPAMPVVPGILEWFDIESNASGGTFDPGDEIIIVSTFEAIAESSAPDRTTNSASVAINGGNVSDGPATADVEVNSVFVLSEVDCAVTADRSIAVSWTDMAAGESEFEIQAAVGESGFMPLRVDPSRSGMEVGEAYEARIDGLLPGMEHRFRVRASNRRTGDRSAWVETGQGCRTAPVEASTLGCVEGQAILQGRSSHAGLPVRIDGAPATTTLPDGSFRVCGVPEGPRVVRAGGACYLAAQHNEALIIAGDSTRLPTIDLVGGDVDENAGVDLYDLVRVGADFRSSPPTDPAADCTADGTVNIFDIVLVGANYDRRGPVPWDFAAAGGAQEPLHLPQLRPSLASIRASERASGAGYAYNERLQDDGTLELDIVLVGADPLYGVDFTLEYDPNQIRPLGLNESTGQLQIDPGPVWEADAFVARNKIDHDAAAVRFAASLRKPAAPLSGQIEVATLRFEILVDQPDAGAYALTSVKLADPRGNPVDANWGAVERGGLSPDPLWEILLPFLGQGWLPER